MPALCWGVGSARKEQTRGANVPSPQRTDVPQPLSSFNLPFYHPPAKYLSGSGLGLTVPSGLVGVHPSTPDPRRDLNSEAPARCGHPKVKLLT